MNEDIPSPEASMVVQPGPVLLGGLLQSFLLGTIVNQAFKYWMDYRDDSWRKRLFVIGLILLAILQTILEDYKVWRALILHRRWSTSHIEWSDLFINGCICWLCEVFYIRRCWKIMEREIWVLVPLSVLSVFIMASNIYLAVVMSVEFRSFEGTNYTETSSRFLLPLSIVAFSMWIFGSLVLEMTVTTLLLISLWRSKTGFREVDKTVLNVIHLTWESAILPTLCMVIAVGIYHAARRMHDHLVLLFVLLTGKFYAFGVLRTLNSRAHLRRRMESHEFGRTSLSAWGNSAPQAASESSFKRRRSSEVTLDIPGSKILTTDGSDSSTKTTPPVQNLNTTIRFASSIEINTPSMDAEERGTFRNRVCSSDRGEELVVNKRNEVEKADK